MVLALAAVGILAIFGMMSHAENRYGFVIFGNVALLAVIVPLAIALPMLGHDASYFSRVSMGERWNYKAAAGFLREHAGAGETVYSSMPYPLQYYMKGSGITVADLDPGAELARGRLRPVRVLPLQVRAPRLQFAISVLLTVDMRVV